MKKIIILSLILNINFLIAQTEENIFHKFTPSDRISSEKQILDWIKSEYQLNENETFEFVSNLDDNIGENHKRYKHTIGGIPVFGSTLIIHSKGGIVKSINGKLYSPQPSTATITEKTALESSLKSVNASQYYWESEAEENLLKKITSNPTATYAPKGKLVYVPENGNFSNPIKLCYQFEIYSKLPEGRWNVYTDANSGQVIWKINNLHTGDANGKAVTKFSDTVNIITDSVSSTEFRLHDYTRGSGVITYNNQTSTNPSDIIDFTDTDNFWNNVNAAKDEVAGDAHYGAEMSYDYFKNIHNRDSYNNNGGQVITYVHYDKDLGNANWNGYRLALGDGGFGAEPFAVIDIVGHELAHGVTEFSAGLVYAYEPGALNESFSDIFGVCIDAYANPNTFNYLMGEQTGFTLRNMGNPKEYANPDTYLGDYWQTGAGDNGGVHTNSGVQNYWFYLLAEGGSGTNDNGDDYVVEGLGIEDAAKIAYRNLSVYLSENSQYEDARNYSIESAIDLFGECSYEVKQVTNAWYAVGVGEPYDSAVTADFIMSKSFSCEFPAYIELTNNSTNATDYEWYLPEDNFSDTKNISTTITEPGIYEFKLIASNDVSCFIGPDTLTKQVQFFEINAPQTIKDCAPQNTSFCCQVGIKNFQLNDINRTSGDASEGYQDYTCNANTILQVEKDYKYQVTVGSQIAEVVKMYIDLDNNGTFDRNKELIDSLYAVYDLRKSSINIPKYSTNIYNKPLRLRIMSDVQSKSKFGPCDELNKGQAEDYTVILVESENYTLGAKEEKQANFVVYPNPTSNTIEIVSEQSFNTIQITDLAGRMLQTVKTNASTKQVIDLSTYQNGVYFVRLASDTDVFSIQKIVKQ